MTNRGFLRTVLFAAVAGLAAVVWLVATGPILGRGAAITLFALLSSWSYLIVLAERWPQRLLVAAVAGLCVCGIALLLVPSSWSLAAAALLVAVTRSVFLSPGRPARAVAVELFLVVGGLTVARLLLGSSPISVGLAFWGFFLTQSIFFLVARGESSAGSEEEIDPFVRARDAATALMREL